jgi:hypothetical protein
MSVEVESPEGRLYAAGFTRSAGYWVAPGTRQPLSLEGAIAYLDSPDYKPPSHGFPDTGVRALSDELVDLACPPPRPPGEPPAWLVAQAQVIAQATVEKMKPLIRAEVRAALRAEARKRSGES